MPLYDLSPTSTINEFLNGTRLQTGTNTFQNSFQEYVNIINTNQETDMESRQQLTERALRFIFATKRQPDYTESVWEGSLPVKLYTNQWHNIIVYNNNFGSTLCLIDPKNKKIVSRKDTVFLAILQEFAERHGYKLCRPPRFPTIGNAMPVDVAHLMYEGEPMES